MFIDIEEDIRPSSMKAITQGMYALIFVNK